MDIRQLYAVIGFSDVYSGGPQHSDRGLSGGNNYHDSCHRHQLVRCSRAGVYALYRECDDLYTALNTWRDNYSRISITVHWYSVIWDSSVVGIRFHGSLPVIYS